jgi:RNA 2',3'-cyclic 3'-phosphodiesterase
MAERWFFSLWPDAAARRGLVAGSAALVPPGVCTPHPLDLHLTLVFLGELAPAALDAAVQAADALRAAPLALRIDRAGYFARARALWCGPADPSPDLTDLQTRLVRGLAERGLVTEHRPYAPHITLARKVRQGPSCDWDRPVEWVARELVLAHRVEGQVPRYARWRVWPLGDAPPDGASGADAPGPYGRSSAVTAPAGLCDNSRLSMPGGPGGPSGIEPRADPHARTPDQEQRRPDGR